MLLSFGVGISWFVTDVGTALAQQFAEFGFRFLLVPPPPHAPPTSFSALPPSMSLPLPHEELCAHCDVLRDEDFQSPCAIGVPRVRCPE